MGSGEGISGKATCLHARVAMPAERAYVVSMPPTQMTAEELLNASIPNKRTELVRGVLVVREPPGGRHGSVTMKLALRIGNYVERTGGGQVFAAETGFTLSRGPDTVPVGFPDLAPDLVVEVLSPGDRAGEILAKVADWLSAGTRLVWVVDPERRLARIYRHDGSETIVPSDGP